MNDLDSRRLAADVARHVFRHQAGLLLGGLLHNLRSPLGGVVMLVSYLREAVDSAVAEAPSDVRDLLTEMREHLVNIESCSASVEAIIGDMSRYQQRTREAAGPQRDLNLIVSDVVGALRADLDIKHRVEIRLELDEEPLWVGVSPADVVQVLLWLTANARDAVLSLEERVVAVRTGRMPETQRVWLEVADSGDGLDEGLALLTEPYASGRQSDPAAQRRGVGAGLGGFLTDCIVESLGGSLEIHTGDDGTTVRVNLPAGEPVPALLDE